MNLFNPLTKLKINVDIDMNAYIIWVIWACRKFRNVNVNLAGISRKMNILYFLLFYGLILGIINFKEIELMDTGAKYYGIPLSNQIVSVSVWILTVILFINILLSYRKDDKFHSTLITVFISTVFFHVMASVFGWFLFFRGADFINYSISINRFPGLFIDRELIIDYCLMVMAFSIITINKHNTYSIICLIASIIVGLLTGSRSFIIIMLIFLPLILILQLVFHRNNLYKAFGALLFLIIPLIIFILSSSNFFENLIVFERLAESQQYAAQGNYIGAFNRDIEGIPVVFENVNPWGAGAGYFFEINNHQMVCHNLFLAMYAKYGVFGIFLIIYLFYVSLKNLFLLLKNKTNKVIKRDATILFSLLIALFFQQQKISFIREITPILFYSFLFINIYFKVYNFNEIIKMKRTS